MEMKFVRIHRDAKLPEKNNKGALTGDAGYDLFASAPLVIKAQSSGIVQVGLKLGYITPGFWFRIEPRSGLGFKKSIQPHLGVIDNGYRGDLKVKLYNFSDEAVVIEAGDGIAQIIPYEMLKSYVGWIQESSKSIRGEKGFGSSDKKEE